MWEPPVLNSSINVQFEDPFERSGHESTIPSIDVGQLTVGLGVEPSRVVEHQNDINSSQSVPVLNSGPSVKETTCRSSKRSTVRAEKKSSTRKKSDSTDKKFNCTECGTSFSNKFNLKRHFSRAHSGKDLSDNLPKKIYKYTCGQCSSNFNFLHHFRAHQRAKHPHNITIPSAPPKLHRCYYCPMYMAKQQLFQHYDSEHGIKIEKTDLQFNGMDSFQFWKADLETNEKCIYVIERRTEKYHSYRCHRSGYHNSKSRGVRQLKKQGSKKMNYLCPSNIKVKIASDGKYTVTFTKTHIGHQMELCHIPKSAREQSKTVEQQIDLPPIMMEANEIDFLSQQLQIPPPTPMPTETERNSLLKEYTDMIRNANKAQLDFIKKNLLYVKASISKMRSSPGLQFSTHCKNSSRASKKVLYNQNH